jgi:hypothetical protein
LTFCDNFDYAGDVPVDMLEKKPSNLENNNLLKENFEDLKFGMQLSFRSYQEIAYLDLGVFF